MYVIQFARISANSYFLDVEDTCDTEEEVNPILKKLFEKYLAKGFDQKFSKLDEDFHTAFLGSYEMSDVIILHAIDTEHPVGIEYNPFLEFAITMHESGDLDE